MSENALREAHEVDREQAHRNDARRILQRVVLALKSQQSSGVRWPFELLQNAHDFGAREGEDLVEVEFCQHDENLVVSHNGRIFSIPELKALLSGGSSKEFDGIETTGRFGTGFLVTHAISSRVDVDGILQTADGQLETFRIELNRPPDEALILKNIELTDEAFGAAQPAPGALDVPTASFTYHSANPDVVRVGLDRLEQTLPYLYGTCDNLGQVRIRRPERTVVFRRQSPAGTGIKDIDGFLLKEAIVTASEGAATRQLAVVSILATAETGLDGTAGDEHASAGLLLILKQDDGQKGSIVFPEPGFPRIFVQFPINETGSLPFNTVFESRFNPKQERDGITMNPDDRTLLKAAISAFPSMVEYAVSSGWENAHGLALIDVPNQALGGETAASEELAWWKEVIGEVAAATASKPIISTSKGYLPAISDDEEFVSFPVHAVSETERFPLDYDSLYDLAERVANIRLPDKAVAGEWEAIAGRWAGIGLPVNRVGLRELVEWVKAGCRAISDLPIAGDPFEWLADLLLLISGLPEEINKRQFLNGMVPDQHSQLRSAGDLRFDGGISEDVKDIADTAGLDLRSGLLHAGLVAVLGSPGYEPAKTLAEEPLGRLYSESEAIEAVLDRLEERLPDDSPISSPDGPSALHTSARLVVFLAPEEGNAGLLRRCPLLTSEDKVVRLANNLQILAPVSLWHDSARPYKDLYTQNRVLSDQYTDDAELNAALALLIERSLALPGPFFRGRRSSPVDGPLLKEIAPDCPLERVAYGTHEFGQIAFLANELVPRCGNDENLAELLLGFVVNVAAKEDPEWHNACSITLRPRDGEEVQFQTFNSTWPFELKVRSWIPVVDEEGKIVGQVPANEANLRPLLGEEWLQDNSPGIDLLHRAFGFRQLTLMLESMDKGVERDLVQLLQDPDLVKSVAANLDLIKATVSNPEVARILSEAEAGEIQEIREELDKKKRQIEIRTRNSNFGHAVQEAVKKAVEALGLRLELVDWGYDYEVFPDGASFTFEVGSYFLEVKATTTRDVRLTPTQANKAWHEPDRFVLCVVDLFGQQIKEAWEPADIVPWAKFVTWIGGEFEEIHKGVTSFSDTAKPVHLRNEEMLRYGVSVDLWSQGVSIAEWVRSLPGSP